MLIVFALVYTTSDVFTTPLATTATVGMVFLHAVTVSDFRFCLVRRRIMVKWKNAIIEKLTNL